MTDILEKRPDGSVRVQLLCEDESLTRQSEADSADINKIVARYEATGTLPWDIRQGRFADVTDLPTDFREALEKVQAVEVYFGHLPASVRAEFDNNPAVFLDFMQDPANLARARELGILEAEPKPAGEPPAAAPGSP